MDGTDGRVPIKTKGIKRTPHYLKCLGAICAGDPTPDWKKNVVWYPGEPVCNKSPYQKWQKRAHKINRWVEKGLFKYPRTYFTAEMLEGGANMSRRRKGGNPNKYRWFNDDTGQRGPSLRSLNIKKVGRYHD